MATDFLILQNALFKCKTVDDFFNNPDISIEQDFKSIIEQIEMFSPELLQPFVKELISTGKTNIIKENIQILDIQKCTKILNDFPEESKEIFENFVSNNFNKILESTEAISNISELLDNSTLKSCLDKNMGQAISLMDSSCRENFLNYLSKIDDGTQKIEQYMQNFLISDKKIHLNYILQKIMDIKDIPTSKLNYVISSNIEEILSSSVYGIDFERLLSKIDTILEESKLPENEFASAKQQIEKHLAENFDNIMNASMFKYEGFSNKSYDIDMLKTIMEFNTDRNLITNKFIEEYPNLQEHVYKMDVIKLENLTKGLEQIDSIKSTDILVEKMYGGTKDENTKFVLSRMIKELMDEQNLSIADINICGAGMYSSSIKIGNYIMKVGAPRETNEYANSSRIIKPLVRKELPFDYSNPEKYANIPSTEKTFIEVQNAVDANWYKGLSEEEIEQELYKIYAELRDDGVVWKDVKKENVGRLLKPNITNYEISGKQLEVDDKAIGVTKNSKNKDILQKGELVVIDTDFLYDEELLKTQETSGAIASMHKKFEERYQKEKLIRIADKLLKKSDNKVNFQERTNGINYLQSAIKSKDEKGREQEI